MKTRKLKDGSIVQELETAKILEVKTKCPEKWKLIDLETGEEYVGWISIGTQSWKKINGADDA